MNSNTFWYWIGNISGVLGIVSFIASTFSLIYTKTILHKIKVAQSQYQAQRKNMLIRFRALQENIWNDYQRGVYVLSQLEISFLEYKQKFWSISSLVCKYHVYRAIHNLRKPRHQVNFLKLKHDVNYIIARLNKEE